jgi:DivIVA domain-containing protein
VGVVVVVLVGMVVLVGAALALALSDGGLGEETIDHRDLGLPDRPLSADDIATLSFRTGARGYRMEDVDAALERITEALRASQPPAQP